MMNNAEILRVFLELRSCLTRDGSDIAVMLERPDGADRVLRILSDTERIIQRLQPVENKGEPPLTSTPDSRDAVTTTFPRKRDYIVSQREIIRRAYGKKVGDYEQRLPRERFQTIWGSLVRMPPGRDFSPQDLAAASKVPSYQAYIAIDLLLSRGVLDSPRRGAFRISSSDKLTVSADDVWASIEKA